MSDQQPNAWHTARPRHAHSASRTPQNRSGTASLNQPHQPHQLHQAPPRQEGSRLQHQQTNSAVTPSNNKNGGSGSNSSNGPSRGDGKTQQEAPHTPANGFNATEVKAFLGRERQPPAAYKPDEAPGAGRGGGGGGGGAAWGSKPNHMANNQPFFVQLAKQLATMEGGG